MDRPPFRHGSFESPMVPATATADSFNTASPLAAPNKLRARMLIAAALALVVCRLLSLRHSVAGMAAGGIVMVALAIAIIVSTPRLRRWMFWLTLPVAAAVNAAALAVGSCAAWLGSQGLLPGGRLGMKVAWQPLFWCAPVVAAITLSALARASGPGLRSRRAVAVAANLLTVLLGLWYWAMHEAQSNPLSAPPLGAVLLLTVAAVSLAALVWDAPASTLAVTPGRRRAWWRAGFVALTAVPIVAAIVMAFLPIYQHRRDVAELESLGFSVGPGRLPRRIRKFDELFPVYDYLAEIETLAVKPTAEVSAADAERIEQLLQRQPAFVWLDISNIRPGAGRLLRSVAGRRSLTQLTMSGPGVTDETLADIAALPSLEILNISHSSITDEGLAELTKSSGLQTLNFSGTKISSEGLSKLASLPRLSWLDLADVPLTNSDLSALEMYPTLKWVNLKGTGVTEAGILRLRQALPRLGSVNVSVSPLRPGAAPAAAAIAPAPPAPATGEASEGSVRP